VQHIWLLGIAGAVLVSVFAVLTNGFSFNNDPYQYSYQQSSCKCVAIRLDDVQDYFLTSSQEAVINTIQSANAPLTVGVIANYFGNDTNIVKFIRNSESPNLEIANHGWNHEDFTKLSRGEQMILIHASSAKISELLGVKPVTFIPPFNALNNDTAYAARDAGIKYISANTTTAPQPFATQSQSGIIQVPGTSRDDYDNGVWFPFSHAKAMDQIDRSIKAYGFAVVVLHPQEFAVKDASNKFKNEVDQTQISELRLLLEQLHDNGYKLVTVSQIT
jgi:peptidoglycan/xylan/chitin deacetylase (PgdA/CDA1 family)